MPRGGARKGAGRKAKHAHYRRHESIGRSALKIGQRCEVLWRESYETNVAGMHQLGAKRPRSRKKIIAQVMAESGEKWHTVIKLWKEYRQLEADLDKDLPPSPV